MVFETRYIVSICCIALLTFAVTCFVTFDFLVDLARFATLAFLVDQRLKPMSNVIEADLVEFNELQDAVNDYLNANDSSKANAM